MTAPSNALTAKLVGADTAVASNIIGTGGKPVLYQRTCDRCGRTFAPRAHSGGSPQRFCSSGCRLAFHAERQHNQRAPACEALPTSAATGQPANERVLLAGQEAISIGRDQGGNLELRQGDAVISIHHQYGPAFAEALRRLLGEAA